MSSHWDREWYQPFQDYRNRLVQLLDRVLEGFADGRLRGPFTTDGQTIVLDDFLEIRPERAAEVRSLVADGRVVVGPWYVLPDEFLVSGESIVRNIRLGMRCAREYGAEPSRAGWLCDLFGHNSQMPQIMHGFGITAGFLWRGVDALDAHVRWRGADGSEMLCYRFGKRAYCNYAMAVRSDGEVPPEEPFVAEDFQRRLTAELDHEAVRSDIESLILFDGADHNEWDQAAYAELSRRMDSDPNYEIVHTTLDAYIADMVEQGTHVKNVLTGELRQVGSHELDIDQQWAIPGVLSSRVWIKQANAECETLLTRWAEPVSALASALLPRPYPTEFLNVAWKWLLQNHPHDSICGCSIDTVHEDMKYRFSQTRQIATRQTIESMTTLATSVDQELDADALRVVVFNPIARPVLGPFEITLQIPAEWPTFMEFFDFERKPAFRIYDADGVEVVYQVLHQRLDQFVPRLGPVVMPSKVAVHLVRVAVTHLLPALGYTTLTVRAGRSGEFIRHPATPGLATADNAMANEHIAVAIESNGTLTLTDLATGQRYDRLLTFEDIADIGDGWYHGVAVNDAAYTSTAARAAVALVHNGPQVTTFRVRTLLESPARFDASRGVRSTDLAETVIDNLITLRAGAKHLEIESTVTNVAEDHRLRVLFPTDAKADTYLADSAFDVVERPIAFPSDAHTKREMQIETTPQQSWTAVFDDKRGLAVVSTGLLETAVRDIPTRPLALTLFRGTSRTIFTNGEPNGELLGKMSFRYWVAPLAGNPDRVRLFELGQALTSGTRDIQIRNRDIAIRQAERYAERVPATSSLLAVEGPAVVTSARTVDGGFEVRLFNPHNEPISAQLTVNGKFNGSKAEIVNLESIPQGALVGTNSVYALQLRPKEIQTVRLS